jgi:hypothetical protein
MIVAADGVIGAIVVMRGVAAGGATVNRHDTLRRFRAAQPHR